MHWGAGGWKATFPAALLIVVALDEPAHAQRTDIVTLANGDRITGEVSSFDRGRLEYKTDDQGTIYIEWDKVASVMAAGQFEVGTSDGRRFVGSLKSEPNHILWSSRRPGPSHPMTEVTVITQIGCGFWKKLHGSIDVGFSSTRSSDITPLNANTHTVYRSPSFDVFLAVNSDPPADDEDKNGVGSCCRSD